MRGNSRFSSRISPRSYSYRSSEIESRLLTRRMRGISRFHSWIPPCSYSYQSSEGKISPPPLEEGKRSLRFISKILPRS
jgi:hypothetical protein